MPKRNNIKIDFGEPEHGWLLMNFRYKDYALVLDISNVPVDPMFQLCDALIEINKGSTDTHRIIWHLEPYCYYLL